MPLHPERSADSTAISVRTPPTMCGPGVSKCSQYPPTNVSLTVLHPMHESIPNTAINRIQVFTKRLYHVRKPRAECTPLVKQPGYMLREPMQKPGVTHPRGRLKWYPFVEEFRTAIRAFLYSSPGLTPNLQFRSPPADTTIHRKVL